MFPVHQANYATRDTDTSIVHKFNLDANVQNSQFFVYSTTSLQRRNCFRTLKLARSHNLQNLLPSIFLVSMALKSGYILTSHTDEAGNRWKWSNADIVAWFNGRESLNRAIHRHFSWVIQPAGSANCEDQENCSKASQTNAQVLWQSKIAAWKAFLDSRCIDGLPGKYCSACNASFKKSYNEQLAITWETLPINFHLPKLEADAGDGSLGVDASTSA